VLGAAYAGWKAWAAQSASGNPADPWKSTGPTGTYAGGTESYGSGGTGSVSSVTATKPTTDDSAGAGPDEAISDAADEAKAEDESPSGAAGGTTTEPVTRKNARKVSEAAAKGSSGKGSTPTG
jgi:hypothetical protein